MQFWLNYWNMKERAMHPIKLVHAEVRSKPTTSANHSKKTNTYPNIVVNQNQVNWKYQSLNHI